MINYVLKCYVLSLPTGGAGVEKDSYAVGSVHIFGLLQSCNWFRWSRWSLYAGAGLPGRSGLENRQG